MRSKEEIRQFRNSLAGKNKVQPSSIFPDESIDMLYELQPMVIDQLIGKPQFPKGGQRIEKYGQEIIRFFRGGKSVKEYEPMNLFAMLKK